MTTFLLFFFFASFFSCPCLGVCLARSHIPSPSLPAQTPCGVPFPRCGTGHNGVAHTFAKLIKCSGDRESQPRLRKAAAAAPPRFPLPGPRGRVSRRLPVTEPRLPLTGSGSNRGPSNGKCHGTLRGMCMGRLWESFVLSRSSAEGQQLSQKVMWLSCWLVCHFEQLLSDIIMTNPVLTAWDRL